MISLNAPASSGVKILLGASFGLPGIRGRGGNGGSRSPPFKGGRSGKGSASFDGSDKYEAMFWTLRLRMAGIKQL